MLATTLGVSLLETILAGKGVLRELYIFWKILPPGIYFGLAVSILFVLKNHTEKKGSSRIYVNVNIFE